MVALMTDTHYMGWVGSALHKHVLSPRITSALPVLCVDMHLDIGQSFDPCAQVRDSMYVATITDGGVPY
jgi:hypothetical protein